ncbi:MAG: phosphogluconate dehydrogenase (NAD(+)-dependent, decarboxylating) [Gemmatimonadaceae bacterium]
MELGMIGLGRMGANMVRRLMAAGHQCIVYDHSDAAVSALVDEGATGATRLPDFVTALGTPRHVWLMVPAGVVDAALDELVPLLEAGDTVIDGGNSNFQDDIARGATLRARGVHYVDVGVSGGVWGRERGYCLMIGGEADIVRQLDSVFRALAPGIEVAPPTPGRPAGAGSAEQGYLHCGPHGAGHFVKMVHNAIEYGMMASLAEGFNILSHAGAGRAGQEHDAETTPLRNPEYYQYEFALGEVAEVWRRGSVVGSWLLDLTAQSLVADPHLEKFAGRVSDSGEGRWTLAAANDLAVPAHVLASSLFERFSSRGEADYANRMLSAMRFAFGGHLEKPAA